MLFCRGKALSHQAWCDVTFGLNYLVCVCRETRRIRAATLAGVSLINQYMVRVCRLCLMRRCLRLPHHTTGVYPWCLQTDDLSLERGKSTNRDGDSEPLLGSGR